MSNPKTAIELLLTRQSNPNLTAPVPDKKALDVILAAGMRVPDHACLHAWHANVITGKGLQRLSDIFVEAVKHNGADEVKLEKTKRMPFRAPMIIIISTKYVSHEKVPEQEQLITAGCCAHAMQMAAFSLGYGAMWRTGVLAYNEKVKSALAIKSTDEIVGFLYIGTISKTQSTKTNKNHDKQVSYWQ